MDVRASVRSATRRDEVRAVGRVGFAGRATIYLLIGIMTMLLAFGHQAPETDQRGAMQALEARTGGFLLLLVLTVGLFAYGLWMLSQAVTGVAGQGKEVGPRVQAGFSALAYGLLGVNGIDVLVHRNGKSEAGQQQSWTARVMAHDGGRWLIGLVGLIVIAVGLVQAWRGARRQFTENFRLHQLSRGNRRLVLVLGTIGTIGRGLVFALTGWFVLLAAINYDPGKARGLDGALRQVAQSGLGRFWVGLAALGLIAFALFGYTETAWRRT